MNIANANVTKSKSKCDIGNSNITNAKRQEIYLNNKKINKLLGTKKKTTYKNMPETTFSIFIHYIKIFSISKQRGIYACIPLKTAAILSGDTTIVSCSAICASVVIRSLNGCFRRS